MRTLIVAKSFFGMDFVLLYSYWIQGLFFIMFGSRLLSIVAVFVACVYCGKDFQLLTWHSWRRKKKLNNTSKPNEPEKTALQLDSEPVSGYNTVKCVCGKECKWMKGLKMHQRRCRVMDNTECSQPPRLE